MGTYFPPLNLTLDADERAVKRAYAAALKATRPDDDPAAFQVLVAARDRALDWVRRRGNRTPASIIDELAARGVFADRPLQSPSERGGAIPVDPAPAPDIAPDAEARSEPDAPEAPEAGNAPLVMPQADIVVSWDRSVMTPLDPAIRPARGSAEPGFAAMIRSQQTSRQVLSLMAIDLIRDIANNRAEATAADPFAERWDALLLAAEDLDLNGRMALERLIAIELDGVMQQAVEADPSLPTRLAATVLRLDRAFRWSQDPRRIVRILGEPSGSHPLLFAIESFGESAIRLRFDPHGFPIIPTGDLVAWFGSPDHTGVKAYRQAEATGRFGIGWSWYAFLSPPAWSVRTGLTTFGIGFTLAAIIAVYVMFDPIANVGTANSFISFLAVVVAARVATALSARTLETSALVRIVRRIESGPVVSTTERRARIAAAHGPKLLNVIVGLFFLLLVDGYCLSLIVPAMNLKTQLVASMIVVPDRKTPGVTFADRLVAESYIDHAREIEEEIGELVAAETADPSNPLRRKRIDGLQQSFLARIKTLPIGDYVGDFDRFRREIGRLKRHQ